MSASRCAKPMQQQQYSFYKLARHCCSCIARRGGCFAIATQFVTLLATPAAFVRAATMSCNPTSFISSFVRFIPFHSPATPLLSQQGVFYPPTKFISQNTPAPSQARWFIPLHYAQLRHSFISVGCSPPAAAVVVLALRPASAAGCHGFCRPLHIPWLLQKHTPNPCVSLLLYIAPLKRCSLYSTVAGTRRQFRRTSSIAFDGEQPGSGLDKCAKPALLLLAAGAITFLLRTNTHATFLV